MGIVFNRSTPTRLCLNADEATLNRIEALLRESGGMVQNIRLTPMGLPCEYLESVPVEVLTK
jgi:hypothetical protein